MGKNTDITQTSPVEGISEVKGLKFSFFLSLKSGWCGALAGRTQSEVTGYGGPKRCNVLGSPYWARNRAGKNQNGSESANLE